MGYNEIPKAYHLYEPSTQKVIEYRDFAFTYILIHGSPRSFPLLSTVYLQMVLMDLYSPHSDNDSPSMSVFSSTLLTVTGQMDNDGEKLNNSLEVFSFIP